MRLGILFIIMMLLNGCRGEPDIYFCLYDKPNEPMTCIWTDETKPEFERDLHPGDLCTSIENFGKAKKHHADLHRKLDGKNL